MRLTSRRHERGFGKLELALLVLLSAVVIALALPGRSGIIQSRIASNELAAQQALVMIAAAQESWRQEAHVDQDLDTEGEYGLLGELAGRIAPRTGEKTVEYGFIPPLFGTGGREGADGCAVVNGYVFRIFLVREAEEPDRITVGDDKTLGGTAAEPGAALTAVLPVTEFQRKGYVLYAWPLKTGETGNRAYVVTQAPPVYQTDMRSGVYSGRGPIGADNVPDVNAAFAEKAFRFDPETGAGIAPDLKATGRVRNDGNVWQATSFRRPAFLNP